MSPEQHFSGSSDNLDTHYTKYTGRSAFPPTLFPSPGRPRAPNLPGKKP